MVYILAKRNPVRHSVFLLCCGLKAGRSFKPRQSSELPVAHTVFLSSVGRVLEVSPCALLFVEGSDGGST